jgi:hypothetical protein
MELRMQLYYSYIKTFDFFINKFCSASIFFSNNSVISYDADSPEMVAWNFNIFQKNFKIG